MNKIQVPLSESEWNMLDDLVKNMKIVSFDQIMSWIESFKLPGYKLVLPSYRWSSNQEIVYEHV
jgi:hypothetical protein